MSTRLSAAVALAVFASGAHAQTVEGVSGCYRFDRAFFSTGIRHADTSKRGYQPTDVLRLYTVGERLTYDYSGTSLMVRPVPVSPDWTRLTRADNHSGWSLRNTGEIHVKWGSGFTGSIFKLRQYGDTLSGTVKHYTDDIVAHFIGLFFPSSGRVRAVRVVCPS